MTLKKYAVIVGIMGILLLSGCAENPSEDIVVNKNEGVLEQAILEQASEEQNADIPDTYADSFQSSTGNIIVQVDADILKQDTELPVLRVLPHEISSEDLQRWAEVLFEGNTAYDGREVATKSDIEQNILELRESMNNGDLREEASSEKEYEEYLDYYEDLIADLQKEYETAPESYEPQETDWTFHSWDYYEQVDEDLKKTLYFIAKTKLNGYTATIKAANRNENDYLLHTLRFLYEEEGEMEEIPYRSISVEEAQMQAEQIIEQIQPGEWELARCSDDSSENVSLYQLEYVPKYEGVPMAEDGYIDIRSEDLYAANLYYTVLRISIMNGIVQSAELLSPMDVEEVVNENVKTLSFEEIYDSFKNYAQASFSQETLEEMGVVGGVTIDQIEQKLFRIKEKNSEDSFLIVPVWVFSQTISDGENQTKINWGIVNAVDGSMINETLGY